MKKKYISSASLHGSFSVIVFLLALLPFTCLGSLPLSGSQARDTFPDLPVIDNAVNAFMVSNDVPGVSLAITKNEELVYVKGYGFADRETGTRVRPESLFRIASISKPLTSIVIMKLAEQNKLSLDDKIFGPDGLLKTRYGRHPYKKGVTDITVRHLLRHLSGGWGNSRDDPMFTDPSRSTSELISFTLDTFSLEHVPGTHYDYSNFGYCLLGRVIETITGQDYETYMKTALLTPAGVSRMQIGGNTLEERKRNEVKYYGRHGEDPYKYNISRMDAHGGWIASATDLVKILMLADGSDRVKDIISSRRIREMVTVPSVSPGYACGWSVDAAGNWQHGGSLPGTRTVLRKGANGYGYAVLLNTRSYDSLFNKGFSQLMEIIQGVDIPSSSDAREAALASYRPAGFADSGRWARMKAAFPVIEKMYRDYAKEHNIPGLAFGVVGNGQLLYSGGIGFSNIDKKIPVSGSSVYRIASMTKSFTAMAILLLRDAGKLDLDDPVSRFIPEISNTAPLTGDSPPITIRNLLTHTAGFPEDNPWGNRQLQRTDEELIDFLKKGVSLSSPPGLGYEYSNLGFAMLGNIVTKASGEHYTEYINKNIFQPLGMDHTYWEYTDVPEELLTRGYRLVNGHWREEELLHSGAYGAMGGLLTSIEDFSKYMNLHLSAWPPASGADTGILKTSSIREMHIPGNISRFDAHAKNASGMNCPRVNSYNFGLGWSKDCTGREQVGHSGGLPGFGTHWIILPGFDIGIVSFSNLTYAATSALNATVIDTLIAMAGLKERELPVSGILEQRKNELVQLLPDWENAASSGIFSENFFSDYFVDSLRKEARTLFSKAGRIIKVGEMIPDNQLRGNFIIEAEETNILVRFTLSPENPALIQQYLIRELPKTAMEKYGLQPVSTMREYNELLARDASQQLVNLEKFIPGVAVDVRYATSDNLMKRPLYRIPVAYMRQPAAQALKAIQEELNEAGYGLKIYDGYRPYNVTVTFYERFRDTAFVASPYTGSRHNRGCAVDLTLIDLKTGKELEMPTPYDTFTKRAHSAYKHLPARIIKNRDLLQKVMLKHGFLLYPDEWWHFDFAGWEKYPVMDIPFELLKP